PADLLVSSRELSILWRERFRRAVSDGCRGGAGRAASLRMGQASARRARRLVGGDNFHPFSANVHSRESGGGGYVAGVVCDAGALGGVGTGNKHRTPNIERRTSNSFVVGHLLRFVGVGVSGQGADWVDAV